MRVYLLSVFHPLRRQQLFCKKVPNLNSKSPEAGQALLKALVSRILCLSCDGKDLANVKDASILHQIYSTWIGY